MKLSERELKYVLSEATLIIMEKCCGQEDCTDDKCCQDKPKKKGNQRKKRNQVILGMIDKANKNSKKK